MTIKAMALTHHMSMPIMLATSRSAVRRIVGGYQKIPRGRDSFPRTNAEGATAPETLRQKDRVGR
jgi:hypothetical protein